MADSLKKFNAVIFDLDGTLADTLGDIASAANHAFAQLGFPIREVADFRYLAGQGLRPLFVDALPDEAPAMIDQGVALFRKYYAVHNEDQSKPYDGIADLLDSLTEHQIKKAILSNKPDTPTQQVANTMFKAWDFDQVLGHREPNPLKPDPTSALAMASDLRTTPDRCMYVGDTMVDMQTAKRAGMYAVGVLWGFRDEAELREHGADAIVSTPCEIAELLGITG